MAEKLLFEIDVDADYQELIKLQTEMEKLQKQQKEDIKNKGKSSKVVQKQKAELKELNTQYREASKQLKVNNVATKNLDKSYNGLTTRNRKLSQALRQLQDPLGKDIVKFKQLSAEINKNTANLSRMDKAMGRSQRNVGNYGSGLKGLGKSFFSSAAGAAGLVGGAQLVFKALGSAVNIIKDFQQGNANLASVLGKTRKEIVLLSNDAKRLGASTSFSASQVTELQTEFAKLGFKENEIINATEATLNLAAATGSDLATAAAVAGATLGGFGLDADQTARVTDVMAKSFSTSALDMEKFQESMKSAAPAAAAVGISIEETTALLGTMANAGISGSKAGNNLKTSFINLNAAGLTLEEGLEQVSNSQDKLGTATKLVGKNAAASFLVLANGKETTAELTEGFNNAGGAAQIMADEQLDTLDGKLKILNSSWEGLILSLEDGEGSLAEISKIIVGDLAVGLSVLGGNLDAAGDKFSYMTFLVTSVKTQLTAVWNILKLSTIPLQVVGNLVLKLARHFGIVSDSTEGFTNALLKVQKVFTRLPQIITIVVDGIINSFLGLTDVVINVAKLMAKAFSPIQLAKDMLAGKKPLEKAFKNIADSAVAIFEKGVGEVPDKIAALFEKDKMAAANAAAEKAGEKLGESVSKGTAKGLKKSQPVVEREATRSNLQTRETVLSKVIAQIPQEEQDKINAGLKAQAKFDASLSKRGKTKEEKLAQEQEIAEASLQIAQETSDAVFSQQQANNERSKQYEIDQLMILDERKQDQLQSSLDSGLLTQEEYENNRLVLEMETQAARLAIEKAAFEKKKRLDTAQAIINGALAVTKIFAQAGVASPVLVGAAIASTAIQVATIQSQKFARGGMLEGASHEQGGIQATVDGKRPVELEGGESIINKKSTAMFKDQLNYINQAGGGVPLYERGGYVPKFANGGLVSGGGGSAMDLDRQAQTIIDGINDKKVINVASETIGTFDNAQSIENEMTI